MSRYTHMKSSTLKESICGCMGDKGGIIDWCLCYPCMFSRTCLAAGGQKNEMSVCICLLVTPTWLPLFYNLAACGLRQSIGTKYLITDMGCGCNLQEDAIELKRQRLIKAETGAKSAAEDGEKWADSCEPPEMPDVDEAIEEAGKAAEVAKEEAEKAAEMAKEEAVKFCQPAIICEAVSNLAIALLLAPCSNCQMTRELRARDVDPGSALGLCMAAPPAPSSMDE